MALYGIYGSHTVEAYSVNNLENAKRLISFAETDPTPLLAKYQINNVLGQYHSAFEHTFIWIVDADDSHLIEELPLTQPGEGEVRLKVEAISLNRADKGDARDRRPHY